MKFGPFHFLSQLLWGFVFLVCFSVCQSIFCSFFSMTKAPSPPQWQSSLSSPKPHLHISRLLRCGIFPTCSCGVGSVTLVDLLGAQDDVIVFQLYLQDPHLPTLVLSILIACSICQSLCQCHTILITKALSKFGSKKCESSN